MTFEVRVSAQAERDVDMIFDWLAQRIEGAIRWYQTFLNTLRTLPSRAEGCGIAYEAEQLGVDLRQTLFKTRRGNSCRIAFIIRSSVAHVLAVRGTGQDLLQPDDIVLEDDEIRVSPLSQTKPQSGPRAI